MAYYSGCPSVATHTHTQCAQTPSETLDTNQNSMARCHDLWDTLEALEVQSPMAVHVYVLRGHPWTCNACAILIRTQKHLLALLQ